MNAFSEDTIAAISTPVAPGGIGMVRISGPQALEVADRVFRSVSGKQVQQTEGYRGLYGRVHDGQGEIDEAVVFVYRAPKSYTGENVAEICCHGGVYLVQRTLRACIAAGARPAHAHGAGDGLRVPCGAGPAARAAHLAAAPVRGARGRRGLCRRREN